MTQGNAGKKKIKIIKGTIFAGNGKDETAEAHIEKDDDPFTGGFCTTYPDRENEWFIFPDRIARSYYMVQVARHSIGISGRAMEDVAKKYKAEGVSRHGALEKFFEESREASAALMQKEEFKLGDDVIIRDMIDELESTVLHEVGLHLAGGLPHDRYTSSISFGETYLNRGVVLDLLEKYGIDNSKCSIYCSHDGTEVNRLRFKRPGSKEEETEEMEKIKALYEGVKSPVPEAKMWYSRRQYPVKFEVDDIKLLPPPPKIFN